MVLKGAGFAACVASAVFNGSFAALSKLPAVRARDPDPVVFNLYACVGVFASSWCAVPFFGAAGEDTAVRIRGAGVLAGALFVGAVFFSFVTIPLAGLSMGQCVWGGTAVGVAFLWGAAGPEQVRAPTRDAGLSVVAVALILFGIAGAVLAERVAGAAAALLRAARGGGGGDGDSGGDSGDGGEHVRLTPPPPEPIGAAAKGGGGDGGPRAGARRRAAGLACAVVVGAFGGSILAPMSFSDLHGITFLPSFGVGALGGGALVAAGHRALAAYRGEKEWGGWHAASPVSAAGVASGCVWNLGNICQIWAQAYAGLAYGVAYPILQCALVFSGLIGIFCFREITDRGTIAAFFAASAVILAGAALLGVYGPQAD